ncbi:Ankyrin repeat and SOCS box protein 13 [Araneus ventricosus]|uniref:Ankyrin repeat and SOCS box protein 13 n=1 Tax=Araneus ventricosus TaxID=182803 RepID=A0A4Y2JP69_ARAVE|nr:Ankyrin repeat and SOCS box protein 13 [Araneus ventricosus]
MGSTTVVPENVLPLNAGSSECVSLLIEAGAYMNANDCHVGTPLHAATFRNRPPCVELLLQAGASVNATKIHETALHIAARENYVEAAEVLIKYGANVYASNNLNKLPVDLLPETEGKFYDLLIQSGTEPVILKDLCRRKIRSVLGSRRMKRLKDLDIPRCLVFYLMYKE